MTPHSASHTTFVIQRQFQASLKRVWRAFADPQAKRQWFTCSDDMRSTEHTLDFRPGGHELSRITAPDGEHLFDARYLDIIPERRIIYAYAMQVNAIRLSASLATIKFAAHGPGTEMTFTEQVAFLDGHQRPEERIHGTELGFDMLERWLGQV